MPPKLFDLVVPETRLSYAFGNVRTLRGCAPARDAMEEVFATFEDIDGNFVQQFQTDAYEARLFELFLAALFHHEGFARDTEHARPDYVVGRGGFELCVEAVTANPTHGAPPIVTPPDPAEGVEALLIRQFKAARDRNVALAEAAAVSDFQSRLVRPLVGKLRKRYWELPHVAGKPLVLAVQDFSSEGSLMLLNGPFSSFLYSDFFHREDAEQVSAVMFVNTGTSSKFTRMRYQLSPASYPAIHSVQRGGFYIPRGDAKPPLDVFHYWVGDPRWTETWSQGICIFHNPEPLIALSHEVFPGTKQLLWSEGMCRSEGPAFHPEASLTVTSTIRPS